MNLARAQKALRAVQRRQNRHLHVRRAVNDADVRELVAAGLLEASFADGSRGSSTILDRVTAGGDKFLKVFPAGYRFCEAH